MFHSVIQCRFIFLTYLNEYLVNTNNSSEYCIFPVRYFVNIPFCAVFALVHTPVNFGLCLIDLYWTLFHLVALLSAPEIRSTYVCILEWISGKCER